tara:strand:+ start:403 stop:582 length:180 start_codon:yes stop_codon:yes gene_type:complete
MTTPASKSNQKIKDLYTQARRNAIIEQKEKKKSNQNPPDSSKSQSKKAIDYFPLAKYFD